jgi:hypothetical protein
VRGERGQRSDRQHPAQGAAGAKEVPPGRDTCWSVIAGELAQLGHLTSIRDSSDDLRA